jgi:hypothetical protein
MMALGTTMMRPADGPGLGDFVLPVAQFRAWLARAEPGEWLEYHRGLLALDRTKGTSSLKEAERRRLAAVAHHAFVLAGQGTLHLLQKRRGQADYSYWAVAARSLFGCVCQRPRHGIGSQSPTSRIPRLERRTTRTSSSGRK